MIIVYFLLPFLLLCEPILPTSYYISSSTGNDLNNGLFPVQAKENFGPFASFGRLSEKSFFKPGDKIFLKSGDKWENLEDIRFRFSGSRENPILISSYAGNAFPELKFKAKVAGFYIHNHSYPIEYIKIEKISLTGDTNGWGVFISEDDKGGKTKNITLSEMKISHFKIGIHSQIGSDLEIENSEIFSMGEMGILGGVHGSGLTIQNNRIYANGFSCPRTASVYCHNIYLSYGEKIRIERNDIYGASNFGIIFHGNVRDIKILDNEIFQNNNAIAIDPGYSDKKEGFKDVIVSGNRVHDHRGSWLFSFQSIENLLFSENIIYGEPAFTVVVRKKLEGDAELNNAVFKNNTIVGDSKKIFSFHDSDDENRVLWKENRFVSK